MKQTLFTLGKIVATPAAIKFLESQGVGSFALLQRHQTGDWGDLSHNDAAMNDGSLVEGSDCFGCRIFSSYKFPGGKVWIITEAVGEDGQRASTCVLLPDDY